MSRQVLLGKVVFRWIAGAIRRCAVCAYDSGRIVGVKGWGRVDCV